MMTISAPRAQSIGRGKLVAAAVVCAFGFALYGLGVPENPPGFYIDESSIAYNAYTIAQSGKDEHGEAWPLYFRAFGDHKNPTYVYILAAVFRVTGPSIAVARWLSASLGALAALLLGLLAFRLTARAEVGFVIACSALLTPWLYESSRLVFEVAAYPIACVIFLLALRRASSKDRWDLLDVVALACSLALLTYTYSIGRLLAPLLALGLAFFISRRNLGRVLTTWAAYAVTLAPLTAYSLRHPGALQERLSLITYITPQNSFAHIAQGFALHYLADINPWRWLVTGEQNIRDHLPGSSALLLATVLLAILGAVIVLREHRAEAWWRFQLYALAACMVPAALTVNDFPQLRLIAFPVFLHVFTAPAVARLLEGSTRRLFLYAVAILLLSQAAYFQWRFHERPPERWYIFDERFPLKVLAPALDATAGGPIYLYDPPGHSGYIQALWHGTLQGIDAKRFARSSSTEPPPAGAVVISTEEDCANCRLLARSTNYIVYAIEPSDLSAHPAVLDAGSLHALLVPNQLPSTFTPGVKQSFEVIVRNVGTATWPAVADIDGRYAVTLHARWLRTDGTPTSEQKPPVRIPYDMEPGDTAGLRLETLAPAAPGQYVLELNIVQDGGPMGSEPMRMDLNVVSPE